MPRVRMHPLEILPHHLLMLVVLHHRLHIDPLEWLVGRCRERHSVQVRHRWGVRVLCERGVHDSKGLLHGGLLVLLGLCELSVVSLRPGGHGVRHVGGIRHVGSGWHVVRLSAHHMGLGVWSWLSMDSSWRLTVRAICMRLGEQGGDEGDGIGVFGIHEWLRFDLLHVWRWRLLKQKRGRQRSNLGRGSRWYVQSGSLLGWNDHRCILCGSLLGWDVCRCILSGSLLGWSDHRCVLCGSPLRRNVCRCVLLGGILCGVVLLWRRLRLGDRLVDLLRLTGGPLHWLTRELHRLTRRCEVRCVYRLWSIRHSGQVCI